MCDALVVELPYTYDTSDADPPHQPLYLAPMLFRLQSDPSILVVLDAGCGDGNFAASLAQHGFKVYGVDLGSGIPAAQQRGIGTFCKASVYDDLTAPFDIEAFDAVIATEVIEHLYSPRDFIKRAEAALRPGGLLILTTPYWGYWKTLALAMTGRVDLYHTALWDGGHIKHWSRKTLTTLVQERSFQLIGFDGDRERPVPYFWHGMMLTFRRL